MPVFADQRMAQERHREEADVELTLTAWAESAHSALALAREKALLGRQEQELLEDRLSLDRVLA